MIKYFKISLIFLLIFLLSCSKNGDSIEVGFLITNISSDRWKKEAAFFTEKIEALNGKVIIKSAHTANRLRRIEASLGLQ